MFQTTQIMKCEKKLATAYNYNQNSSESLYFCICHFLCIFFWQCVSATIFIVIIIIIISGDLAISWSARVVKS